MLEDIKLGRESRITAEHCLRSGWACGASFSSAESRSSSTVSLCADNKEPLDEMACGKHWRTHRERDGEAGEDKVRGRGLSFSDADVAGSTWCEW